MVDTVLQHIAIIMDGNTRWAKKKGLPGFAGHKAGARVAKQMIQVCHQKGVSVLTLFALSCENWQRRPLAERMFLVELFTHYLKRDQQELHAANIQVRFVGDRTVFPTHLRAVMEKTELLTRENTGMLLAVCMNYSGQWDITQACARVHQVCLRDQLPQSAVTVEMVNRFVALGEVPPPDLLIRTSGEKRISNFFLWQIAYTELFFTDRFWPEFDVAALDDAITQFHQRQRRFGARSSDVPASSLPPTLDTSQ